jgi:hypothetical protein
MLKRLFVACAILAGGAALFYAGAQAMPWVLSRPSIMAQRQVTGIAPTQQTPKPTPTHTVTPPTSRTPTRLAVTAIPGATATRRPDAGAAPTVTPIVATFTPMATFTWAPTVSFTPTPSPQRTVTPTAGSQSAPVLIAPPANETLRGRVTFSWRAVELPPGAEYEVVWWRKDADPNTARGLAESSPSTSQSIDLSAVTLGLPTGQPLYWTVLIVRRSPVYSRLLAPQSSNGRPFMFQNNDDGPSCVGAGCK